MKAFQKVRYPLLKIISGLKKIVVEDNFMIFSEPRGGSTWLSQMINTIPKTALIWEPINPKIYKELRSMDFGWRQFIPENEKWAEANLFFKYILTGKKLTYHTSKFLTIGSFLNAEQLLIKFVRGNAILPWLTKQFNLTYKPIYLVRHPFAVVQSQLRHGAWKYKTNNIEIPKIPFSDVYSIYRDFLASICTIEESLVANWCMANKFTLQNDRNNKDWITVYYEHLIKDPNSEIQRIFDTWNLSIPQNIAEKIKKPSITVKNDDFINSSDLQISKWMNYFSTEKISLMNNVLKNFEIMNYNKDDFYPTIL